MNFCHRSSECHSFGDVQLQASVWAFLLAQINVFLSRCSRKYSFFFFKLIALSSKN